MKNENELFQVLTTLTASSSGMMLKNFQNEGESNSLFNPNFEDYYDYEEPLPQGPTRPPSRQNIKAQKEVVFPGMKESMEPLLL